MFVVVAAVIQGQTQTNNKPLKLLTFVLKEKAWLLMDNELPSMI
jgi:hypothetical protein